MSEAPTTTVSARRIRQIVAAGLARRNRAERRFRLYGVVSLGTALLFLAVLLGSIVRDGYSAFWQTYVALDIEFDEATIDPAGTREPAALAQADYSVVIKRALAAYFPEVQERTARRQLHGIVSGGAAFQLRDQVVTQPSLVGTRRSVWVLADDEVDMFVKGRLDRAAPPADRRVSDQEIGWLDRLAADGRLARHFNVDFFTAGDSRDAERAGIWGAVVGSALTLCVTLLLAFPLGVATAVYLEEFAPRSRWTDLIEVNINNLAAVPSIVFGLLGLAVFINFFGLPRSAPLVGGLVLTLMTLPTIIIASRASLAAVPPSIREAALGMGASRTQMVTHHVLPLAMPGVLTGTIIGMARALGETAPLLMIGMVAFIVDVPRGFTDAATALPVQIYLWVDSPERAFVERTSAAIIVLLGFLIAMNALAVFLRRRLERRW
jgi:phosphate transport system permease protein